MTLTVTFITKTKEESYFPDKPNFLFQTRSNLYTQDNLNLRGIFSNETFFGCL